MILQESVEVTRNLWQSWAVTAGGLVSAVIALTVLTKIPGGRALFKFLVADPVTRWIDRTMDRKITDATAIQMHSNRLSIEKHVSESIAPLVLQVEQINTAVNNVAPGTPAIKDRVARCERKLEAVDGKVDTIIRLMGGHE